MIRIRKPAEAPKKLAVDGKAETEKNKQLYKQFEDEYKTGERKFEFKASVYGHKSVKDALKKAQHHKCCFCEKKTESGDVEHFRPKSGYYWLAYEWDNLFYCCPKCNRSFKRNLFSLADDSKRAESHLDNIDDEEALLIHPAKENPEELIEFIGIHPKAVNGNRKGSVTIEKTGIDRPFLNENRLEAYKTLKIIHDIANMNDNAIDISLKNQAIQKLNESLTDSSEYSSMIRCAVRDQFRY